MVDKDSGHKNYLDKCDEELAELAERVTRLEEENRQLRERAEEVTRKTWWQCELPNTTIITLLLVLLMFIILQMAH
jgi:chromosome segregation ATPase